MIVERLQLKWKGLIRLALTDSQELQKTDHVKSYIADTSTKYTGYLFQYENGSFFIKYCLEKS